VEDAAVKDHEAVGRGRDEPAARCERRVGHPLLRDQRRAAHALREAAVISQQSYLYIYGDNALVCRHSRRGIAGGSHMYHL
jgi:hypothetical protein